MHRRTLLSLCAVGMAGCTQLATDSGDDDTGETTDDDTGGTTDDDTGGDNGSDDSTGEPPQTDAVSLELIADGDTIPDGPSRPLAYEPAPGTDGIAYIADQTGVVYVVAGDELQPDPLLDIRDSVIERESWEQGLLGIEPHPQFATTPTLYVRYSAPPGETTPDSYSHTFVLSAFQVDDSYRNADPNSERRILEIPEPQADHNSGAIVFGPDGYLYVGVGDGGSWGDIGEGHAEDWYEGTPGGNGQDITENLLGGVLRIDVEDSGGEKAYGIPEDNPLVGSEGLDEYYAWGLRNPYRLSFDSDGTLYAGDVGGTRYEEINIVEPGGNYGWNVREGFDCQTMTYNEDEGSYDRSYESGDACPETTPDGDRLIDPIVAYENTDEAAASVVCGPVYENDTVPAMADKLVFADFVPGGFGHLLAATPPEDDEGSWAVESLSLAEGSTYSLGDKFILDVDRDHDGEVVLSTSSVDPRFGRGKVFRLVPP